MICYTTRLSNTGYLILVLGSEPTCLTTAVFLLLVKVVYMSSLGHGRLATLHDLHTEMPKHTVAYIITCLEINKYKSHKGMVPVHLAMH